MCIRDRVPSVLRHEPKPSLNALLHLGDIFLPFQINLTAAVSINAVKTADQFYPARSDEAAKTKYLSPAHLKAYFIKYSPAA